MDLFFILLNTAGTTDSDRNIVYFNQQTSACGGVTLLDGPAIQLHLDSIQASVQTIIAAGAALDADAPGAFASHAAGTVTITASGGVAAGRTVTGMAEVRSRGLQRDGWMCKGRRRIGMVSLSHRMAQSARAAGQMSSAPRHLCTDRHTLMGFMGSS